MSIKEMSNYVFYAKYAKYNPEKGRRETWNETVNRVFDMHHKHLKTFLNTEELPEQLREYIDIAKLFVSQKRVLGSQRALQFGGEPILKHHEKLFNCSATYIDRPRSFQESLYVLLCGCGVGASVQKHHVAKLPGIAKHTKGKVRWVVEDSIEGWADALGVLMNSYFTPGHDDEFDESIIGAEIEFDFSRIRPAGSLISGGFLAPGPKGLQQSLERIKGVIERRLDAGENRLHPIDAYDILMHASDAVLSGGLRRSACLILFSKDDEEMLKAKTGTWFTDNPQRGRSNNSVAIKRNEVTKEDFLHIIQSIKEFGEPGFLFVDDYETLVNPCCLTGDTTIKTLEYGNLSVMEVVRRFQKGEALHCYSADIETGNLEYHLITKAFKTRQDAEIMRVVFGCGESDELNQTKYITCTPDHPIYVHNENFKGYKNAEDLTIGDKVAYIPDWYEITDRNFNDKEIIPHRVIFVERLENKEDVYDLTVENTHNFFANGILVHNCEISFNCHDETTGKTGFSFCNLCEINIKKCKTEEDFYSACKAAAVLGTIQASYTTYTYLTPATKNVVEKEALMGVSMTGMMDVPDIAFDPEIQRKGAKIIKKVNEEVAKLLGINPSARTTCVKPSGSVSLMIGSASGIHPHHARRYIRRIQANVNEFPLRYFESVNPFAVETSVWSSTGTDKVVLFPCEVPAGSITKNQLSAIDLLEKVKLTQQNWVEYGTTPERSIKSYLRANVSNTISVKLEEWNDVATYLYNNRKYFTGVSLLSVFGDKDLPQTPLTTIYTASEIAKQYGNASMMASGIIIHAHKAFDDNLWKACNCALGTEKYDENNECQSSWITRVKKFADRYFEGDIRRVTYLLKDVDNLKYWLDLNRQFKSIDWSEVVEPNPHLIEVDTTVAAACAGGKCEVV